MLESGTMNSQETLETLTEVLAPLKLVNAVGRISFTLILVPVVQFFFKLDGSRRFVV